METEKQEETAEIVTPEVYLWTNVRDNLNKTLERLNNEITINKEFLATANRMLDDLKSAVE